MFKETSHLHVVAEAGTNHGGSEQQARNLVDIALNARAHSVKFQIIYPEGLYLPKLPAEDGYQKNKVFDARKSMMLGDEAWERIAQYCIEQGMPFSASVFDMRGIKLLDRLNAPYIKFASCDLNNSALLKAGAETGRSLVISTGMASLGEIERALTDVCATGNTDVCLLHCVSMYPASLAEMNLRMITTLKSAFGVSVGLSDHTETSHAAAMAVALGARVFEKHFTYDRSAEGFDHAYAMEPTALAEYIGDIEAAISAMDHTPQKLRKGELEIAPRARRGIHAARDVAPGEYITEADVTVVRPAGAFAPNDLVKVVGARVRIPIRKYQELRPEMLA